MSARRDLFERLVTALERLAPSVEPPTDWLGAPAYIWRRESARSLGTLDAYPLDTLRGIDEQKHSVVENLTRFARGHAAHDMLLWGARGMGKSALLRSATSQIQSDLPEKLALVQLEQSALCDLPHLFGELAEQKRQFVLYIDDLGFGRDGAGEALSLRSALEGGVATRPANVRIAVTSNRRAIVSRSAREQESPLSPSDDRHDALALADRFGLSLGFHPCDRSTYLEIARAYTEPLGLSFDDEEALAWSIARGALSGRVAWQFATELAGRAGKQL